MFGTMKKFLVWYYKLTFIPSLVLGGLSSVGLDIIGWYQGESPEQFCEVSRLFGPLLFFLFVMTVDEGIQYVRKAIAGVKL